MDITEQRSKVTSSFLLILFQNSFLRVRDGIVNPINTLRALEGDKENSASRIPANFITCHRAWH